MPHISAKIFPGRSEEAKLAFAQAVREAAVKYLNGSEKHITVSVEDVAPSNWYKQVYIPEVINNPNMVLKPQYSLEPNELQ